jgi:hypothetical protein
MLMMQLLKLGLNICFYLERVIWRAQRHGSSKKCLQLLRTRRLLIRETLDSSSKQKSFPNRQRRPKKKTVTKSTIGGKEGDKSRDVKKAITGGEESPSGKAHRSGQALNRTNERRKKVLQDMREHQATTKTGPEPATTATVLTIDDQRQLLYDEDAMIKNRWSQYSPQITTLAGHLEVLLEDDRKFFDELGTKSVQGRVNENDYTGILYRYLDDSRTNHATWYEQLVTRFKFKILADEYVIIHAMDEDVEEIQNEGVDKNICVDLQYWVFFLSKMDQNVTDKAKLSLMNLGSELHTFPADASLDLMQNLSRRLEALQDW